MTQAEACQLLNLTKGAVSQLVKKGMPLHSIDAANAWRAVNAPPRKVKGRPAPSNAAAVRAKPVPIPLPAPAPIPQPQAEVAPDPQPASVPPPPPPPSAEPDPVAESRESDPRDSVRMARLAEKAAWSRFAAAQKSSLTSPDEFRRINAAYIAARQNRMKAEEDFREWRRQEGITLFLSEAQEICARPHQAVAQMLSVGPKQLAPRLYGQPIREIERTLIEWADSLSAIIRKSI